MRENQIDFRQAEGRTIRKILVDENGGYEVAIVFSDGSFAHLVSERDGELRMLVFDEPLDERDFRDEDLLDAGLVTPEWIAERDARIEREKQNARRKRVEWERKEYARLKAQFDGEFQ